jgi:Fe-S-cluster containining protein
MGSKNVFALGFHADYRCRHSGACCTADWDVPVELPVYRSLSDALVGAQLQVAATAGATYPFVVEPDLPDGMGAMLERDAQGRCVFYDTTGKRCIVHRDLGEPYLPTTCRHFPRVSVQDRRGTFVSLSHFCPTAASMLFSDGPVEIVAGPPAFPDADYDGLIVTPDDLPPLLHPRVLMDLEGYTAWERHMVGRCADVQEQPESILATLMRDADLLRRWQPGGVSLSEAVWELPHDVVEARPVEVLAPSLHLRDEVIAAVPDDLKPPGDEGGLDDAWTNNVRPVWYEHRAPINRFLAAKAFASWTAYQGRGVKTIVRGLEAALALLRVEAARQCRDTARRLDCELLLEAFRQADFALNHLAVGEDLANAWSVVEDV